MNRTLALVSIIALFTPAFASAQTAPSPLAAPSPTASATPLHYSFTPPANWMPKSPALTESALVDIGSWASANASESAEYITLDLVSSVKGASLDKLAAAHHTAMARIAGENNVRSHPEKVCGGTQDGAYTETQVRIGVIQFVTEQMIAIGTDGEYIATYGRLKSTPESPAARAALNTLCAKTVSQ